MLDFISIMFYNPDVVFPQKDENMKSKSFSVEDIVSRIRVLLEGQNQVWVRVRPRKSHPHWSRAKVEGLRGDRVVIKPIKHGGRLELVPASDVNLWSSMNTRQVKKSS